MTVTMNVFIVSVFAVVHNCTTVSGADPGADCVFPFTMPNGVEYTESTMDFGAPYPWCSTLTDQNGNALMAQGKWGICASNCTTKKGKL